MSAAPPFKPYQPTPDWPALTDRTAGRARALRGRGLAAPENVTVLDPYRRKRDDEARPAPPEAPYEGLNRPLLPCRTRCSVSDQGPEP